MPVDGFEVEVAELGHWTLLHCPWTSCSCSGSGSGNGSYGCDSNGADLTCDRS